MTIHLTLPPDAGPRVTELADRIQRMAMDPEKSYSDQDGRDTAIAGLTLIVAELERDVAKLKADAEAASSKASFDELQRRSYDTGR
ncbi:hypothetical protein [Mycobacterium sp. 23]|uniref:hypothetical protein n=1 Tax=Mycobacterium sp. 23 TaxID=3400424 RepID=UPI003AAD10ED